MIVKKAKITDKQRAFIDEYLVDCNATQAAIRAGFSPRSAKQHAHVLLNKKEIAELLEQKFDEKQRSVQEQCLIPVGLDEFLILKDKFPDASELKKWASLILMRAIQSKTDLKGLLVKKKFSSKKRYSIFSKAGFKCQACGAKPEKDNSVILNIDHIIPLSMGGSDEDNNLQVLCFECNVTKGRDFAINHNEVFVA